MKQVLHIFRKDTRHLWIEILTSFAALVIFAALAPNQWDFSPPGMHRRTWTPLLLMLLPATWWLLIGRLIQAESLVGDRQFWLTRPYEWKKLLAAKVLFILLWIYVPFVLMQAVILKEAGFTPLTHAAGWFQSLTFVSGLILLPLIVIAAITENFARMTLTLFGAIAALIAAADLTYTPRNGYEANLPYEHTMEIVGLLILGAILALPLQYALRRKWLARSVGIGTILLATGFGVAMTALRDNQISRLFPASGATPVQVSPAADWKRVHLTGSERPEMVYVDVPVNFSGVAEGTAVQIDDVKITVDDPSNGWHWTAPWWSSRMQRVLPGTHHGAVAVMLSREHLKHLVMGSATMQVTLATTELHAEGDTTATLPSAQDVSVPGFGVCSTRMFYRSSSQLFCRSPLSLPPLTRVSATWVPKACSDEPRLPNSPLTAVTWNGTAYPSSAASYANSLAFGVFPVRAFLVNLNPDWHDGNDLFLTMGFPLCPGAVVHFTHYAVTGRTQVSFTVPNSFFQIPRPNSVLDDQWSGR